MNPNGNARDWQAEARFWQLKYLEQLVHSTQVISALSRPALTEAALDRMVMTRASAMAAAAMAEQDSDAGAEPVTADP